MVERVIDERGLISEEEVRGEGSKSRDEKRGDGR